jgi:hypothetical protein
MHFATNLISTSQFFTNGIQFRLFGMASRHFEMVGIGVCVFVHPEPNIRANSTKGFSI